MVLGGAVLQDLLRAEINFDGAIGALEVELEVVLAGAEQSLGVTQTGTHIPPHCPQPMRGPLQPLKNPLRVKRPPGDTPKPRSCDRWCRRSSTRCTPSPDPAARGEQLPPHTPR